MSGIGLSHPLCAETRDFRNSSYYAPRETEAYVMLEKSLTTLRPGEHPIIHSDRGCQYRCPNRIMRIDDAGPNRSMSRKGCAPDNFVCEGFFGRLKNEMFYGRSWAGVSLDRFTKILDNYIRRHNETRIKLSLGGMSPLEIRRGFGLI